MFEWFTMSTGKFLSPLGSDILLRRKNCAKQKKEQKYIKINKFIFIIIIVSLRLLFANVRSRFSIEIFFPTFCISLNGISFALLACGHVQQNHFLVRSQMLFRIIVSRIKRLNSMIRGDRRQYENSNVKSF